MKAWIGCGLCLAMGLDAFSQDGFSPNAIAQDASYRPALPILGTPVPLVAPVDITPVTYSIPAGAPSSGASIGLGRPLAVAGPGQESHAPSIRSAGVTLDRPAPFVRAQSSEPPAQPLPVGFPLEQSGARPLPRGTGLLTSQSARPMPMPVETQFVAPTPRPVAEGQIVTGPVSSACGCSLGGCGVIADGCSSCVSDCGGCAGGSFGCGGCGGGILGGGILGGGGCCDDDGCARGRLFYGSASYLRWAFEKKGLPPLVTILGPGGVPVNAFDHHDQEKPAHSGARFNFGIWMPRGIWALEVDYLFLTRQSTHAEVAANFAGNPVFRPFFNTASGTVANRLVAGMGTSGKVAIDMNSEMWGLEMNARQKYLSGPGFWMDMLYGYRHLDLAEEIDILEDSFTPGGLVVTQDKFHTRNVFNGPQIGVQGECRIFNYCFLGGTFKVAAGNMRQQVIINGSNFSPGVATNFSGVLAQPTNIGNHMRNRFAVIPEMNFKIGCDINEHLRIWAGYDLLIVSSVVRPGDQIDRRVNPAQILGAANPAPPAGVSTPAVLFRTTPFYAQGVSIGMEYRW